MKVDPADLVVLAQMLGDGKADGDVVVPDWAANAIVGMLYSLPGYANRPKRGPSESEYRAWMNASNGKALRALSREIAEATGQEPSGVRRRLQELRALDKARGAAAALPEPKPKAVVKAKRRSRAK